MFDMADELKKMMGLCGPRATESLISDLKMLNAYDTAAEWQEPKAMGLAFNAMSWEDGSVATALPQYMQSAGPARARVDYAFNAMVQQAAAK